MPSTLKRAKRGLIVLFWYFIWAQLFLTHFQTIRAYSETGNNEIIDNQGADKVLKALKR